MNAFSRFIISFYDRTINDGFYMKNITFADPCSGRGQGVERVGRPVGQGRRVPGPPPRTGKQVLETGQRTTTQNRPIFGGSTL